MKNIQNSKYQCLRVLSRAVSIFLLAVAFATATLALQGCAKSSNPAAAKQKYQCPMHPTYVSDRPGDCPICNMKLVLIKEGPPAAPAKPAAPAATQAKVGQFYCPMDPEVISNVPGQCPQCNMKLVERKAGDTTTNETPAASVGTTPGRVAVFIAPDRQQLIGMHTSLVQTQQLSRTIRATGVLQHDETGYARIAPRFGGWVSKLHANFTGQEIREGEPLFTVYSPDLLAAENEYVLAWRSFHQTDTNAPASQRESARRIVESARRRLELWQVGDTDLRDLEKSGSPKDELTFRAPFSGHIITKTAVEGRSFMAGEALYEIAVLHHLWARASIYEYEMPLIHVGQKARIVQPYLGNKTFQSEVAFLGPHIDPQTRRGEVRLDLDNPGHQLLPDMWVNVEIEVSQGAVLSVPASAVIDTGERYVAFVKTADNHLHPREVQIGMKTDDSWQVLGGLKNGEQVVTRALFLVDSESQLKAAVAGMGDGEGEGVKR